MAMGKMARMERRPDQAAAEAASLAGWVVAVLGVLVKALAAALAVLRVSVKALMVAMPPLPAPGEEAVVQATDSQIQEILAGFSFKRVQVAVGVTAVMVSALVAAVAGALVVPQDISPAEFLISMCELFLGRP
jgi:hypothetical protein